jgi:formylglycine-generating enzyme required for sulfatase activity
MGAGAARVYRGGSFGSGPRTCRAAARFGNAPSDRFDNVGFRVLVSR